MSDYSSKIQLAKNEVHKVAQLDASAVIDGIKLDHNEPSAAAYDFVYALERSVDDLENLHSVLKDADHTKVQDAECRRSLRHTERTLREIEVRLRATLKTLRASEQRRVERCGDAWTEGKILKEVQSIWVIARCEILDECALAQEALDQLMSGESPKCEPAAASKKA